MIQARVTWHGQEARYFLLEAGYRGIQRAAAYLWNTLTTTVLQTPNTGESRRRKRRTRAGPKGSTYTVYPHPSEPGFPPHKRTGFLIKNVIYETDRDTMTARVGVLANAIYGAYLELGTRKMAARPWLFETTRKLLPQLQAIARGD